MKDRNMPKADLIASVFLVCFGIWIIIHSWNMPRFQEFGANPFSVPGIVPGILGTIITILSLCVLIRALRRGGHRLGFTRQVILDTIRDEAFKRMVVTCLVCFIYGMFLIGNISYYLATFTFVVVFLILFQYHTEKPFGAQWKMMLRSGIQSAVVAGTVGAVFRYLFLVDLP